MHDLLCCDAVQQAPPPMRHPSAQIPYLLASSQPLTPAHNHIQPPKAGFNHPQPIPANHPTTNHLLVDVLDACVLGGTGLHAALQLGHISLEVGNLSDVRHTQLRKAFFKQLDPKINKTLKNSRNRSRQQGTHGNATQRLRVTCGTRGRLFCDPNTGEQIQLSQVTLRQLRTGARSAPRSSRPPSKFDTPCITPFSSWLGHPPGSWRLQPPAPTGNMHG